MYKQTHKDAYSHMDLEAHQPPSAHKLTHPYGGLQDTDPRHSGMHPMKIPNMELTQECFPQSTTYSHEYSCGHIHVCLPIPFTPYLTNADTHIFPLEHPSLHPLQPQGAQACWSGS